MIAVMRWSLWIGCGILAMLLFTQPVSVQTQSQLALGIIVAMMAIWALWPGQVGRQIFLALASVLVIRYFYWRLTSTLPPTNDPAGFTFGAMVLAAEIYCMMILAINLIIGADPLVRPALPRDADEDLPTVDVFIPSYNEDEYILATTMAAARSLDYPAHKLTVWLLDDGGTDQKCNDPSIEKSSVAKARRESLQQLTRQMGCRYLTRARNEHAKAGNLNNGLNHATGEIVLVLDADHAPFRSFLRETVGYFLRDPKLFLVQTPHVFLNPDPIEKNLRTFDTMPSENEMFYAHTQRGLDKWNGSFFCGSAALLRRSALITTGGFSGVTITEDCETAFELHARGWNSVYVDKPLIAGLQPETFTSFIGQRSRWCQGMLQILILKNPSMKKGLNLIQRLAYLSSMTFWFFPLPRLIFTIAPLLYIFFDIKIFVSNIEEAIAYTMSYVIVNVMMQSYMYGRLRWPWMSELYEYIQGVFLAKAIVSVIFSPRKPTFNVTTKGLSLDNDHLSELAWPFVAIWGILFLACATAIYRYMYEPGITGLMLIVGLWNAFNMMIAGTALGAVAERKQIDRHPRLGIDRRGVFITGDRECPVVIANVSAGGCAIRPLDPTVQIQWIPNQTHGRLRIQPVGSIVKAETLPVIFQHMQEGTEQYQCGMRFDTLTSQQYFVLADLMYGDADSLSKFLLSRRTQKSVFVVTSKFLMWSVTEPLRALAYALSGKEASDKPKEEALAPQSLAPEVTTLAVEANIQILKKMVEKHRAEGSRVKTPGASSGVSQVA